MSVRWATRETSLIPIMASLFLGLLGTCPLCFGSGASSAAVESAPGAPDESEALEPEPILVKVRFVRVGSEREDVGEILYDRTKGSELTPYRFFNEKLGQYYVLHLKDDAVVKITHLSVKESKPILERWRSIRKRKLAERAAQKEKRRLERAAQPKTPDSTKSNSRSSKRTSAQKRSGQRRRATSDLPSGGQVPMGKVSPEELLLQIDESLEPVGAEAERILKRCRLHLSVIEKRLAAGEIPRRLRPLLGETQELHQKLTTLHSSIALRRRDRQKLEADFEGGRIRLSDFHAKGERQLRRLGREQDRLESLELALEEVIAATSAVAVSSATAVSQSLSSAKGQSSEKGAQRSRKPSSASPKIIVASHADGFSPAQVSIRRETTPTSSEAPKAAQPNLKTPEIPADSSDSEVTPAMEAETESSSGLFLGAAIGVLITLLGVAIKLARPKIVTPNQTAVN